MTMAGLIEYAQRARGIGTGRQKRLGPVREIVHQYVCEPPDCPIPDLPRRRVKGEPGPLLARRLAAEFARFEATFTCPPCRTQKMIEEVVTARRVMRGIDGGALPDYAR